MRFTNRVLTLIFGCALTLVAYGQGSELNFTQYFNTPLLYNPAETGHYDGDCRATALFSSQWVTWRTLQASYEHRFYLTPGILNVGGGVYQDDATIDVTNLRLSVSFQKKFGNQEVIVAIQPIYHMVRGDLNDLTQPGVFTDGQYGTGLETFNVEVDDKFNLNAGVLWEGDFNGTKVSTGVYAANLLTPNVSIDAGTAPKSMKIGINGHAEMNINSSLDIMPRYLIEHQLITKQSKINVGAIGRLNLKNNKTVKALLVGPLMKSGGDVANLGLLGGVQFDKFKLSGSFDFNGSPGQLSRANGFEFSLVYICKKKEIKECFRKVCPRF